MRARVSVIPRALHVIRVMARFSVTVRVSFRFRDRVWFNAKVMVRSSVRNTVMASIRIRDKVSIKARVYILKFRVYC